MAQLCAYCCELDNSFLALIHSLSRARRAPGATLSKKQNMQITFTEAEARKLYALTVDICANPNTDARTLKTLRCVRAKIADAYAAIRKQQADAEEMAAAMLGLTPTR